MPFSLSSDKPTWQMRRSQTPGQNVIPILALREKTSIHSQKLKLEKSPKLVWGKCCPPLHLSTPSRLPELLFPWRNGFGNNPAGKHVAWSTETSCQISWPYPPAPWSPPQKKQQPHHGPKTKHHPTLSRTNFGAVIRRGMEPLRPRGRPIIHPK